MYEAIVFDLDDTLLDYEKAERSAIRGLLTALGRPCLEEELDRVLVTPGQNGTDMSWDAWMVKRFIQNITCDTAFICAIIG